MLKWGDAWFINIPYLSDGKLNLQLAMFDRILGQVINAFKCSDIPCAY